MMNNKTHVLKLNRMFCDDVLNGVKTFEIRKNDRDFKVGDEVNFTPWNPAQECEYEHELKNKSYKIIYILSGWGLQGGWVAFGIKEEKLK